MIQEPNNESKYRSEVDRSIRSKVNHDLSARKEPKNGQNIRDNIRILEIGNT